MGLPVRERILQAVKARFEAATDIGGEPGMQWEAIVRAPLSDIERRFKTAISIVEGREFKDELVNRTERALEVSIEFEIKTFVGEEPATFLNLVLAHIQKTVQQDVQFGGLCLHFRETSNRTDITTGTDKVVGGIIFYEMRYRHAKDDPTRAIGE